LERKNWSAGIPARPRVRGFARTERAASIFSKVDFRRGLSPFFASLKRRAGRDARAPIAAIFYCDVYFSMISPFVAENFRAARLLLRAENV
jgi:hypothetical protein